jgi:hypothetical protein
MLGAPVPVETCFVNEPDKHGSKGFPSGRGLPPRLAARCASVAGAGLAPQPVTVAVVEAGEKSSPRAGCALRFGRMSTDWKTEFRRVWDRGVAAWRAGRRSPQTMFERADVTFLGTIGCTAQELFDFVDDSLGYDDLDYDTALSVAAIRRDYFLHVQHGQSTGRIATMESLPAKSAEVDGIAWLPRLIVKARLKLRGEMPDDLMFGCAGDRPFLRGVNMDLPGFLQLVRDSSDNDRRIIDAVKKAAGRG